MSESCVQISPLTLSLPSLSLTRHLCDGSTSSPRMKEKDLAYRELREPLLPSSLPSFPSSHTPSSFPSSLPASCPFV